MGIIIRVAQVIGHAGSGGVESCIMNYYKSIDKTRVQFDFLVENESVIINREYIESMGGRIIIIPSYKNIIKYVCELKNIFVSNKYDIVHSNMNTLSVFTLWAAKMAGIKIRIAHSHSTSNPKEFIKNIIKNTLKLFSKHYATHFAACSNHSAKWLFGKRAFNNGFVHIIPNSVEIERFKFNNDLRVETRKEIGVTDEFLVGSVGRLVKQKNTIYLIKVFFEFQKIQPNSKLLIVGEGPLRPKLEHLINKLSLQKSVIWGKTCNDVQKYYNALDFFVFPSLYEGLGMTLVEAQINGLPYLASKAIPSEAIISNNGMLLPFSDASSWARMIKKYTRTVENFYTSNYDIKHTCIDLLTYYIDILNE